MSVAASWCAAKSGSNRGSPRAVDFRSLTTSLPVSEFVRRACRRTSACTAVQLRRLRALVGVLFQIYVVY